MDIFLATGNKKKINELKPILSSLDCNVLSIADGIEIPDVVEDKDTFIGNSQKKSVEIAKFLGKVTIADDSGLCVEALGGAPGVYSARYAGEDGNSVLNNAKLIRELEGKKNRKAYFVSVISIAKPSGEVISFEGRVEGTIVDKAMGENGFGYDPHFYYEPYEKTFAEISMEEKNKISHRARAVEKMKLELKNFLNI
jgi:non-canonical purine NTP pyrophosphatase (RdgB/HAM1 family)